MERFPSDSALKNLENELTHGEELAKQLQLLLKAQSSSHETLVYLLNEILNTYDRALSVIEYGGTSGCAGVGGAPPERGGAIVATMSNSPGPTVTGTPHSNRSDPEWISGEKRVPGWTQKVVVFGETGNETQLDDGYSWRKYGQKYILRSKYPRGYYRCTQGKDCLARKQVQRSDEDPTAYEVTYKGLHTCHNNPPIPMIQPQNELKAPLSHKNQNNQSQQEQFLKIQTSLKIIDSSHDKQYNIPSSSNFNPPVFSDDQILCEDYLRDFMYPTPPEFNYFNGCEGLINNSQGNESAAKPPTQDADSSFGFGNSSYFP